MRYALTSTVSVALIALLAAVPSLARQDQKHEDTAADVALITVEFDIVAPPQTVQEADALLERVEGFGDTMRHAASQLKSFSRVPDAYEPLSHAEQLNLVRDRLMEVSTIVDNLEENSDILLPRQRLAVQYIATEIPLLANSLDEAIMYLNAGSGPLWTEEYRESVASIYDSADTIVESADFAEDLAQGAFESED